VLELRGIDINPSKVVPNLTGIRKREKGGRKKRKNLNPNPECFAQICKFVEIHKWKFNKKDSQRKINECT
jgi:hypothetical protein